MKKMILEKEKGFFDNFLDIYVSFIFFDFQCSEFFMIFILFCRGGN